MQKAIDWAAQLGGTQYEQCMPVHGRNVHAWDFLTATGDYTHQGQ